jgi:hypothetical protein
MAFTAGVLIERAIKRKIFAMLLDMNTITRWKILRCINEDNRFESD